MSPPRDYRPRSLRFINGRLQMDLAWPGMAVALIITASIIWAVFQAGVSYERARQQNPAPTEPTDTPPATDTPDGSPMADGGPVLPPRNEEPVQPTPGASGARGEPAAESAAAPEPDDTFTFRKGYHYVVVQHFRKSQLSAADLAGRYLKANGVDCVVLRGADVQLIASTPFLINQSDAAAKAAEEQRCEQLKQRIRTLGKEYAREHGYAFEQCYQRVIQN